MLKLILGGYRYHMALEGPSSAPSMAEVCLTNPKSRGVSPHTYERQEEADVDVIT